MSPSLADTTSHAAATPPLVVGHPPRLPRCPRPSVQQRMRLVADHVRPQRALPSSLVTLTRAPSASSPRIMGPPRCMAAGTHSDGELKVPCRENERPTNAVSATAKGTNDGRVHRRRRKGPGRAHRRRVVVRRAGSEENRGGGDRRLKNREVQQCHPRQGGGDKACWPARRQQRDVVVGKSPRPRAGGVHPLISTAAAPVPVHSAISIDAGTTYKKKRARAIPTGQPARRPADVEQHRRRRCSRGAEGQTETAAAI